MESEVEVCFGFFLCLRRVGLRSRAFENLVDWK